MNEDAAKELVEFVGQLAASVAVLSHGMKVLMNVVAEKDREIKDLQEKAKIPDYLKRDVYISPSYPGGGIGGGACTPPSYETSLSEWLARPHWTITKGDTK